MGLLRLLLAMSVLLGHAGGIYGLQTVTGGSAILTNGDTAVQSFYVISGFYMALILSGKYTSAWVFWFSRYMRLAPLYIAISAATLLVVFTTQGSLRGYDGADFRTAVLAAISNITLIGQDIWMFFAYDVGRQSLVFMPDILSGGLAGAGEALRPGWSFLLIEQGWSIGVEVWFYLLAPFLITRSIRFMVFFFLLSWTVRLGLHELLGWQDDPWKYRFFPSELSNFLLGSIAFRFYERKKLIAPNRVLRWTLFLTLVALCVAYTHLPGGNTEKRWIFVLLVALFLPSIFALTRDWTLDRLVGELSYPVYLVHILVLLVLPASVWIGTVCLALSIAFGLAWNRFVEVRIDDWRYKTAAKFEGRLANSSG